MKKILNKIKWLFENREEHTLKFAMVLSSIIIVSFTIFMGAGLALFAFLPNIIGLLYFSFLILTGTIFLVTKLIKFNLL